ncbi:endo-1,4-beta-xylanase [Rathayibacter sp. YIM 133350]|uniref:endo-1,4-beta-xylanase n=1 Tax=Rathayibacter sp. YIM 133350 TaxID=3131992 RepID=UPI00307DB7A4
MSEPASAAALHTSVLSEFDTPSEWSVTTGSGTVQPAADPGVSTAAIQVGYDLGKGDLRIAPSASPEQGTVAYTALSVSVRGDGSYNTLYVRIRDAAGEQLTYRLGTLNSKNWTTLTADLTKAPSISELGDHDGIIDAPISLVDLRVARNGAASATGSFALDRLQLTDQGWSAPTASSRRVSPSVPGSSVDLGFTAGGAGDWCLLLRDLSGHSRTFTGSASAPGSVAVPWNGTTSAGDAFTGNVAGVLSYDLTPGNGMDAATVKVSSPYLTGVSARPVDSNNASPVGVNSFLTATDSAAAADQQAALLESARVHYAREEFDWNRLEPRKGSYDWWKFDQAVNLLTARNVAPIGKLVYSAKWATSSPAGPTDAAAAYYPPANTADYISYVRSVVARYKDRVHVWEVWNEPNTTDYWRSGVNPARYAEILKASYSAIKQVDPSATVLAGSLAGFDVAFMQSVAANGAGASYDGLSFHTFVRDAPEASMLPTWIAAAKSYVASYNPTASLWITELAWSTCTDGCDGGVDEQTQADYLARSYLIAAAEGIRGISWWGITERGTGTGRLDNYGLVTADGRQKPAYAALKNIGTALAETTATPLPPTDGATTAFGDLSALPDRSVSSVSGSGAVSGVSRPGDGTLTVGYNFAAAKGVAVKVNAPVAGTPTALSVQVAGDGSGSSLYLKFTDAGGESFEAKIGNVGVKGWSRETFTLDGGDSNYTHSGDGVIDYPITVSTVSVYKGLLGVNAGSVSVKALSAHYGSVVRGMNLAGKGFSIAAVYGLTPHDASIAMTGTATGGVVGGPSIPLLDGRATVRLTPSVQYLRSEG